MAGRFDTSETTAARRDMVREVAEYGLLGAGCGPVLAALGEVPRHLFVELPTGEAYSNCPQPIGHGQTISQPLIVAMMTEALALTGQERVLEIGTGCGYQAAVLSRLAAHVDSIERIPELARAAIERLAQLGYDNVDVHIGDGYLGYPQGAPFDRVIVTAAPPVLPQALVEQLADGGILVAPVGPSHDQVLFRWHKHNGKLTSENLGPVRFVPMVRA